MAVLNRRAAILAACIVVLPAAVEAQQARPASTRAPASASPTANEQARGWYAELQQISARLQQAHERALQDAQLREAQASLMQMVKDEMDRADPELARLAERVRQMEGEANAARQRGDQARLQTLDREFAQIQTRFINVESAVLRQPQVAARARAYEQQLKQRMVQVEPQVEQLLARSTELQTLLQRALGAQQGQAGGPRQ